MKPSEYALRTVGREVWVDGERCECVGIERIPGSVIVDGQTGLEWPSIRFNLRYPDGRHRWTGAFPDKGAPPDA